MTDEYLITEDSASFQCLARKPDRLVISIRWNQHGPEAEVGHVAAEACFTLQDGDNRVLVRTEADVLVDEDVIRAMCRVYGIYGGIEAEVVPRSAVRALGRFKAQ